MRIAKYEVLLQRPKKILDNFEIFFSELSFAVHNTKDSINLGFGQLEKKMTSYMVYFPASTACYICLDPILEKYLSSTFGWGLNSQKLLVV